MCMACPDVRTHVCSCLYAHTHAYSHMHCMQVLLCFIVHTGHAAPRRRGGPRPCSFCGQLGHNARSCPLAREQQQQEQGDRTARRGGQTHGHTRRHMHTHKRMLAHRCTHMHTHMYTFINTLTHECMHADTRAHVHKCVHISKILVSV